MCSSVKWNGRWQDRQKHESVNSFKLAQIGLVVLLQVLVAREDEKPGGGPPHSLPPGLGAAGCGVAPRRPAEAHLGRAPLQATNDPDRHRPGPAGLPVGAFPPGTRPRQRCAEMGLDLQQNCRSGLGALQAAGLQRARRRVRTEAISVRPYTVRKGDSLSSIAQKRGYPPPPY